jgi:hypothetical protein
MAVEAETRGGRAAFPRFDSVTLFRGDLPFADPLPLNPAGIQRRENYVAFEARKIENPSKPFLSRIDLNHGHKQHSIP